MSCSAPPVGGSADMYGGKKYVKKRKYHETSNLATLETPILGGRKITRKAHWRYIRGMKIRVPAKRVKDVGAPGKWSAKHGPGIGELKPGGLMGYSPSQSKTARHTKLRKVVKSKGALSTFRKLNALATYTKRTAKSKSRTAKADRNWVKKTYM